MSEHRVWLEVEFDGEISRMPFERFAAENEAAPGLVSIASALALSAIGSSTNTGPMTITRIAPPSKAPSRWVRMSLPWSFDGSTRVTVAVHRDTGAVSFRPHGRRALSYVDLGFLLANVASREAQKRASEQRKARRSRRGSR